MAEENNPPPSKLTRTKQRCAQERRFLTGKIPRPITIAAIRGWSNAIPAGDAALIQSGGLDAD